MCTCEIDSITNPNSTENRLRRECNRALKERNDARSELKVARQQRTAALAIAGFAVLLAALISAVAL
jgi:hypothetical protein